MAAVGIICEYNPFHLGHAKQFAAIRRQLPGADIVCLMSGNYVQRGQPAIFDKTVRAAAALKSGADLVLELPLTYALSSAEGFAAGGVSILSALGCTHLSFGCESGDAAAIQATARALLAPEFPEKLRTFLDQGLSFPAARARAVESPCLERPNDILAVEYCKALLHQESDMIPLAIPRPGDYHSELPDPENPSATSVRCLISQGQPWGHLTAPEAFEIQAGSTVHTFSQGERAVLGRLRTMTEEEFAALPYGSEGLWRKFMTACRTQPDVASILAAVKSKRYTRTRLDRMLLCAFLGLTAGDLARKPPYVRILALNDSGRRLVKAAKDCLQLVNAGQQLSGAFYTAEIRAADLYGLFAPNPEPPGAEKRYRVTYLAADR